MNSLVAIPGGWELVLVVLVILLLFGAKRLPELARGTGRALRIFKAETSGLIADDPITHEHHAAQDLSIEAPSPQAPSERVEPVARVQRDGAPS